MDFYRQLYKSTGTKSRERIIDSTAVFICANDNIHKPDCKSDTFLNVQLAFHCFAGSDGTIPFSGKSKPLPLTKQ